MIRYLRIQYFAFIFPFLLSCGSSNIEEIDRKTNIIFIFIDDMGYSDLSCFGTDEILTPNIDRLAKEGIKFTNFYVNAPICSPSRVAITTGQYPARWHIFSYLAGREKNRQRNMADYLDPEAPSLARVLKNAGYATAHFGKWHMGGGRDVDDAPLPEGYGFDRSLVSFEGLGDRLLRPDHGLSGANAKLGQGNIQWVKKYKRTPIYVDSTLAFIKRNQDQPFYVQLWPGDVHDPFIPDPAYRKKFDEYANNPYQQDFLATLYQLDLQVGRVLDALDSLQLADNTLVVLTSDNGPTDWPFYYEQYYWPPGSADPFRGRKWSLYEGGIRMPLLARWPGQIPAGTTNDTTIMQGIDLFPTICEAANVDFSNTELDGKNMLAAFKGKDLIRNEPVFWEYGRTDDYLSPGNPRFRSPNLAIREGKWKLLINADTTGMELYNLEKDHAETNNVAQKYPDVAERLKKQVLNWRYMLP